MKLNPRNTEIVIHRPALAAIFDECDRYDRDETGGRLVGTYTTGKRGQLSIVLSGVIEPGPSASRSATSFFQDGGYQETVFRTLENRHPDIEHLGNWHTHHVNGYPTLSGGDRQTYHRIVNHQNHNTDFFYALLVTAKNPRGRGDDRYAIKHFVLARKQAGEHEIPEGQISIVDAPAIWPRQEATAELEDRGRAETDINNRRALDNALLSELAPSMRPFLSKESGRVYWRGELALIDGSFVKLAVGEADDPDRVAYHAVIKSPPAGLKTAAEEIAETEFGSAGQALISAERRLNAEIYRSRGSAHVDIRV